MASPGIALVGMLMVILSLSGLLKDLRYFIWSTKHGTEFTSNGVLGVPRCRNVPVITMFKLVIFSTVSMLAFASTYFRFADPVDGRFTLEALQSVQHMSMFCPFIFHSVMELISWRGWYVPDGLVDVTSVISLSWCAIIIRSEENRQHFLNLINALPAYLLNLTACMSLVEYYSNYRSFMASVLKGYFLLCFGTWLLQGSRYLDEALDPKWLQTDDNVIEDIVLAVFGCHLILGQIIIAVMYTVIYLTQSGGIRMNCFTSGRRYKKLCDFVRTKGQLKMY